jgi:pimeloyl-ACP methyl ester carboxylesterase
MIRAQRQSLFPGALLIASVLLGLPGAGRAQNDEEKVSFETVDEVELQGTFYPSSQGTKAPCVLVLHDIGGSSRQPEWADLAKKLQKEGYAVLLFDFRGHGKSTAVQPAFWKVPSNTRIRGASAKKHEIHHKDFPAVYMPTLVNDIAAARRFLDLKNDAKECNSRDLVLIGAQEGATLGVLWLAAEWNRRPPKSAGLNLPPYGEDIAAGIWLSISPTLGRSRHPQFRVDNWIRPLRDRTPMLFLYGEEDRTSSAFTTELCERVLKIDVPPRAKSTGSKALRTRAAGADLLQQRSLGVTDKIISYLGNIMKDRDDQVWMDRQIKKAPVNFVNLQPFGLP